MHVKEAPWVRRRDLGLGPYPEIGLARAREKALDARRLIVEGRDPLAERGRAKALTFRSAAEALIESKRPGWRNAKHAARWTATLATYAYPKLGDLDVTAVDTGAVLDVLRPIWTAKPETASRVRQRIEAVLDYAAAIGVRTGENPARWRGTSTTYSRSPPRCARWSTTRPWTGAKHPRSWPSWRAARAPRPRRWRSRS